eukprot:scaffold471201_cov17-Prasinocladus_malaysianus.AAC.1
MRQSFARRHGHLEIRLRHHVRDRIWRHGRRDRFHNSASSLPGTNNKNNELWRQAKYMQQGTNSLYMQIDLYSSLTKVCMICTPSLQKTSMTDGCVQPQNGGGSEDRAPAVTAALTF